MDDKKLKRLSRAELLELLFFQTKETERLQERVKELEAQLADKQLRIKEAGNLAQAVLEVNRVIEIAQAAADQYLENAARMEQEARALLESAEKNSSDN
ncbi:MAG: DNA repair protein [Acutalibacteraceae bacterium]|nr:DNA repair protein [Acutalibacteraceae bacterium]